MENISDVLSNLLETGYKGSIANSEQLEDAINQGPDNKQFRDLIYDIAFEIQVLRETDEKIEKSSDFNDFMLELSALLKEVGCPYQSLIIGPINDRLKLKSDRLLLIEYLITELMASKMYLKLQPKKPSLEISKLESKTARSLDKIAKELKLVKPPQNISAKVLFEKLNTALAAKLKITDHKKLCLPLYKPPKQLTGDEWYKLHQISQELDEEYKIRKEMLLTRLDVTVQSFQWSERTEVFSTEINKIYQEKLEYINNNNGTDNDGGNSIISDLLAARSDQAIIEKTSSALNRKNTSCKLQKHIIGMVPDRGGRAKELAPPPPEMPAWQKQRATAPSGSGGNRGGGRGGGGFGNRGSSFRGGRGQGGQRNNNNNFQPNTSLENSADMNRSQNYGDINRTKFYNNSNRHQPQQQNYNDQQNYGNNSTTGNQANNNYNAHKPHSLQTSVNRVQGGWSQRGCESNSDNYTSPNRNQSNYNNRDQYNRSYPNNAKRGRSSYNRGGSSNYQQY